VVKVELPETSVETRALVEMADVPEGPGTEEKIVVEPTVLVKTEVPEVPTARIAEVVTADSDAPAVEPPPAAEDPEPAEAPPEPVPVVAVVVVEATVVVETDPVPAPAPAPPVAEAQYWLP